jgi:hypothetical protein
MPAIQAIMRSQVALAAKGNGPAQRAVIKVVQEIERELAAIAAARAEEERRKKPLSDTEAVRRIAWLLDLGGWVDGERIPKRSEVEAAQKAAEQAAAENKPADQAVSGSKPADQAVSGSKPADQAAAENNAADQAARKSKAAVKAPTESKR